MSPALSSGVGIGVGSEIAARESMISFVGALADNKAALGRRYGEWAISAPTLESAVAAAAMAQDELGHARATYPVLKALGGEGAGDEAGGGEGFGGDAVGGDAVGGARFGGERRLAPLDGELPDWTSFVAANLLIDGVLTTFVAACASSTVTPLAQRARKILQEEGSHRVHAEAWARRLCRAGDRQAGLLIARLGETWEHAGRFTGPDDDAGAAAALAHGMISVGAAQQRAMVRDWLVELLGAEGRSVDLPEPTDWQGWDPVARRWQP